MNSIKRILFAGILAAVAMPAFAVGPYDGIYLCSMNLLGNLSSTYITVNTSGTLGVFAVPYLSVGQEWNGYGIGRWSGATLTGNTNYGGPFSATYVNRSINFQVDVDVNGYFYEATGNCNQVV